MKISIACVVSNMKTSGHLAAVVAIALLLGNAVGYKLQDVGIK
jgi:hypothetical protein